MNEVDIERMQERIVEAAKQMQKASIKLRRFQIDNINYLIHSISDISHSLNNLPSSYSKSIESSIKPIVNHVLDNDQKIDNFLDSFQDITVKLGNIDISNLGEGHKIQTDDDWTIKELTEIYNTSSDTAITATNFNSIIMLISLMAQILLSLHNPEAEETNTYIDNSITINNDFLETVQTGNQYITVTDNVQVYAESNTVSDIITTLEIGSVINTITIEDDWTLIVVLNEDNSIEYSGWVDTKYINPVVD